MIILTDTDQLIIEIEAIQSIETHVSYVDLNMQTRQQTPGNSIASYNLAGDNVLLTSPDYGIARAIKYISIYNSNEADQSLVKVKQKTTNADLSESTVILFYKLIDSLLANDPPSSNIIQYTAHSGFY